MVAIYIYPLLLRMDTTKQDHNDKLEAKNTCLLLFHSLSISMGSLGTFFKMDAAGRNNEPKYECLLFDMDDTLYPMSTGLNFACRKNIEGFMLDHLHIEESEVPRMCLELYREHGTTMAGLKALGYEFDNDEYHAYAHGRLPYENLKPDPVLRNLLLSMPQRKIIFTNADKVHAAEVLSRLGLEGCFEGIICFETLNPPLESAEFMDDDAAFAGDDETEPSYSSEPRILCKPSVEAMEAAIRVAKVDPSKTIFFDDSTRNIASGKLAGFQTVIVGSSVLVPGADYALGSIHNIRDAIPQTWEGEGDQVEPIIQPTPVETVVIA